jgi:hypothetical protein
LLDSNRLTAFLDNLQAKGCTAWVDGKKLHVTPRKLLIPEEVTAISQHKTEIIAMLNAGGQPQFEQPTSVGDSGKAAISPREAGSGIPPETTPSADMASGAVIRLSVVANQLTAVAESIQAIRAKATPTCPKHPDDHDADICRIGPEHFCGLCVGVVEFDAPAAVEAIREETAALAQALNLTRSIVEDLRCDLGAATESNCSQSREN